MEQQHSDLGACFGLIFPAAGCECIHLTLSACSLYRYSVDIRTLHGHGCTCNGAKQIIIKCPSCRCNHAIHMVIVKEKTFTLYNESTETFYDVYSETVVSKTKYSLLMALLCCCMSQLVFRVPTLKTTLHCRQFSFIEYSTIQYIVMMSSNTIVISNTT